MDKETFLSKITEIGTCEDNSTRLSMLAEVSEEVSKVYDDLATNETNYKTTIDTLNETIKNKDEKMTKLQEANMDLFLRVNAQKSKEQQTQDNTGIKDPDVNKLKFEDLFKEGGK